MAQMTWTPEQQKVIELRNRNILVSAAAGSGKTAVLVERIIQRICEKENPISIDQLLIVTFTKAAAAEMRERIGKAIEAKVAEFPDNVHLQKQMTLLYSAQITTIDSFCLYVIRNYFHTIDLDPAFRIADEAELTLLKSDVIAQLLEDKYEEGDEDFLEFIECYSASKSDEPIEELILKLFSFSMSYPWPHEWLDEREKDFDEDTVAQLENNVWMKEALDQIHLLIRDAQHMNEKALQICGMGDGPDAYLPAVNSDAEFFDDLVMINSYKEYYEKFAALNFARLSTKKQPGCDEAKKEQVKLLRDQYKDILKGIAETYFFQSPEEMIEDIKKVQKPIKVLISLVHEFIDRLADAKEEGNLVDFADIEHFALQILVDHTDGKAEATNAALDLSEQFEEIMIDEYQDSNMLQEYILTSISRNARGQNNVFMVGDVKQSIYKFRLARPELFMDKYRTYSSDDSTEQKIDLSKNFRSRSEVLTSTNHIFKKIMTEGLGGIEYTDEVALYTGASYPDVPLDMDKTELCLVQTERKESEEGEEVLIPSQPDEALDELTSKELEARAIAKRIKELTDETNGLLVTRKEGVQSVARYSDIVILLRSMTGWADTFIETLAQEGIPAYSDTQSGYFQTLEVKTVLNYLRILDNPQQDIAFTAVLYSPFGKLTSNELGMIKIAARKTESEEHKLSIYEAARKYVAYEESEEQLRLMAKLSKFFEIYDELKKKEVYLSVHEVIEELYRTSGYDMYVLAMPNGQQRYDNLRMLIEYASGYEQSSYHGLFQFVRYIEKLLKYEIDYGESSVSGGNDNAIRIMSIHKSKGLEFPVVFVAAMGKKFNNMDAREKIVIHADYGLGPECIDTTLRTKIPTLMKRCIQKKLMLDNLGEELRILYVAMTRAKEKLIMIGTMKDVDEAMKKFRESADAIIDGQMTFQTLTTAGNYFSFVVPASLDDPTISLSVLSIEELEQGEEAKQREEIDKMDCLAPDHFKESINEALRKELIARLNYIYPFEEEAKLPIKTSVSELKKLGQEVDEETTAMLAEVAKELTAAPIEQPTIPKFMSEEKEIKGSDRGTVVHKIMECVDFTSTHTDEQVKDLIEKLSVREIIDPVIAKTIYRAPITAFLQTDLAHRMALAQKANQLFKEQQFVIGISADEIKEEYHSKDLVLIQGIIDLYFEEDGELVLLDYKTDKVEQADELVRRYHKQLDYYQRALQDLTGKKVKEKIIYSFTLQKAILLD